MKQKLLYITISLVLLVSFSNKTFAICNPTTAGGALTPTTNWQTISANTNTYYTFVANYPGETFIFSFCQGGGSHSLDTQIEIYTSAGVAIPGAYNDDHCGLGSELVFSAPSAGTYRIGIFRYYCNSTVQSAGTLAFKRLPEPTSADCLGALPLCNANNSHPISASGTGNYYDLFSFYDHLGNPNYNNNCPNCLNNGEVHPMWYTFTAQSSGSVNFTINPVNSADDYDWAIYSLNNGVTCLDLVNYHVAAHRPVRCNFCGDATGATGLSTSGTNTCEGPNTCSNWNLPLNVAAGETYAVIITNFSQSTNGYSINFGGSATIIDHTGPYIDDIVYDPVCGSSSLTLQFSERIWCESMQPADFILTGPGGTYNISDTWSAVCEAAAATSTFAGGTYYDDLWTLELSDYLTQDGNYTLTLLNGGVNDICNNTNSQQSINFTIIGITATVSPTHVACYGESTGRIDVGTPSGGVPPYTLTWSGPVSIANNNYHPTGLPAGNYTLTITDSNGICEFIETVTIQQAPLLGYNTNITHPSCAGGSNSGSVLVTGTGGTSPYNIQLGTSTQNGVTSYNFTGLAGGNYSIIITDQYGCTASGSVSLNVVEVPDPTFTYNGNQCFVGHSFNFTHTGTPIAGEQYLWTFTGGTPATSTVENPTGVTWASPGTYSVNLRITGGGCVENYSQNITIYPSPTPTLNSTQPSCGLCNGSITVNPAFNSYAWSNSASTQTISNLCPGAFIVTVTDNNSCTATASTTLTNSGNNPTANVVVTDPTCNGLCNGTATVNASGASSFTYHYSSGSTPNNQTTGGLCDGTFDVTVADGSNPACYIVVPFTVTEPLPMTLNMSSTDATCGLNNGTATVTVSGHTPPANYNWDTGDVTGTITAGAGNYTVTVTDGAGCSAVNNVTINDGGVPFTSSASVNNNVSCYGVCDGSATANASGGTGAFNYAWDNGQSSITATGLCAGVHHVTITQAGCSVVETVNITQPTNPLNASINSVVDAHCGLSDGSITVTVTGGTPVYTYTWNSTPQQTNATASGLASGNYTVTVKDANNCTTTASGFIDDIGGITVSVTKNDITCNGLTDGSATATVNGGSPNYTYSWSNLTTATIPGTTHTVSNLGTGNISVVVTDNFGCTATHNATISQPNPIVINLVSTTMPTCNGYNNATAQINVSGGTPTYNYTWSSGLNPNSPNNSGLSAGNHSVQVSDSHSCTASLTFNIDQPDAILINTITNNATCGMPNGYATATPIGGTPAYQWLWSGGSNPNSQTNHGLTAAGSPYGVTITDANGCSAQESVTIVDQPGPTATISNIVHPACNGQNTGSATVSGSGGTGPYTYAWNTTPQQTSTTAVNLAAGTYIVTVTDANLCTVTATAILSNPTNLNAYIVAPQIKCFGACDGTAYVNVTGGTSPYTYLWNNLQNTQTATNLCAGTYSVTVSDAHGCSLVRTETLTQAPQINVSANITPSNCSQSDGSIDLTVNGGTPPFTYEWSNTVYSEDNWNIPAGAYTVTITDAKFCETIVSYPISDQNAQVVTISANTDATCSGNCNGTATANVTGGTGFFQYSWNTSPAQTNQTATNLCAGSYSIIVTDLNTGCIASTGVTIDEPDPINIISATSNVTCFGSCNGLIDISVVGGTSPYNYYWSGPGVATNSQDQSNLCAGNYSVAILDNNNCYKTESFVIDAPPFITISLATTPTECYGDCTGSVTATPSGGTAPYTYSWSNGQTTATALNLCSELHTVTVTDNNGCTAQNSIMVNQPTAMQFTNVTINDAECNGSSNGNVSVAVIGGTPPYSYVWDNGQTSSNPFGLAAGPHCVTVFDSHNCSIDTCIMVNQPPMLNVTLNATNELCNGACNGTITAYPSGGQGPYSYLWSNTEVTQTIHNLCAGVYNLTITDANNCQAYSSTSINSPQVLGIAVQEVIQPTCGNNNGSIRVGATGGTPSYTYAWSPVSGSSNTLSNIGSGNYTVTITDSHACSISQTVSLSDINAPIITDILITNVDCYGNNTGSAEVIYTSSTAVNTISWSNSQNTALATNLVEGNYSVTVTDDNSCAATENIVITQPQPLSAMITNHADITCFGFTNGQATAMAIGGSTPYIYSWSGGDNTETTHTLQAGLAVVTVTDANGCQATASVNINEPSQLSITGTATNTSCYAGSDGVITVHASGGTGNYIYSWPQIPANTNTITGLPATTYTVIVYDQVDVSCFVSESFVVNEPARINASIGTENSYCGLDNGVAYIANITGGTGSYTYSWNPGNMHSDYITNLAAGSYMLTITDANGCTREYNVNVNATPNFQLDNVLFNGVTCYGYNDGFAQIFVSGGSNPYTYNWTPNVTDQSSSNELYAGIYNVQITDNDGCQVYTQIPISTPEELIVFPDEDKEICIGQSVIISASASGGNGNYSFVWDGLGSGSAFYVEPTTSTNYTVTAFDWKGCFSQPGVQHVEVKPPLSLNVITPAAICVGQASTLIANATGGDGNYIYDWGNGQVTTSNELLISPTTDTEFTVTVRDGCTTPPATATVTASVSDMPEMHLSRTPYIGCVPLNVAFDNNTENMTYNYYWEFDDTESGVNNFSNLKNPTHTFEANGLYKVMAVVTTSMGCKDTAYVNVNVHQGPIADFNAFPWSTGLFEPEIEFSDASVGAVTWEWNFGDGNVSKAQNPTHTYMEQGEFPVTLTVASLHSCLDSITKNIVINEDHRIYFPTAINLRSPGNDEFYPIGVGIDEENYEMTIYNRWGEPIFTTKDWYTHWKGRYNMDKGDYVPEGVYTYVVKLRDKYGKDRVYSGSFMVFK